MGIVWYIEESNLDPWHEKNRSISQAMALRWLQQNFLLVDAAANEGGNLVGGDHILMLTSQIIIFFWKLSYTYYENGTTLLAV